MYIISMERHLEEFRPIPQAFSGDAVKGMLTLFLLLVECRITCHGLLPQLGFSWNEAWPASRPRAVVAHFARRAHHVCGPTTRNVRAAIWSRHPLSFSKF